MDTNEKTHIAFLVNFDLDFLLSASYDTVCQKYAEWLKEIMEPITIEEYELQEGEYDVDSCRTLIHLPLKYLESECLDAVLEDAVWFDINSMAEVQNSGRIFPDTSDSPNFTIIAKVLTNGEH